LAPYDIFGLCVFAGAYLMNENLIAYFLFIQCKFVFIHPLFMRFSPFRSCKLVLFIFLTFFVSCFSYGQNRELEKLKLELSMSKDSLAAMRLMNKIGFLVHMKSADSCFYYGIKANRIAERFGDTRGKADALTNIAIGLSLKGLYSQSLGYYSKAYQAYAQLPDTGEMAQMLMNSSISYSFTRDSGRTKEFARRALFMARRLKTDSILSMLYANFAELGGINDDSSAIYLDKAEKIAKKIGDDRILLFIMQERAQSLLDRKDYTAAKGLIVRSLSLARKHHWDYHELEGLNLYGSYYLAVNQPDSALRCFQQIYRVARANDYLFWKIEVLKSILQVYQSKHDLIKQAETNKLLVEALDKQNDSNNSFLGDYIKYNEDESKLAVLNQLNVSNNKKQSWFIAASILGIITTLIIVWVYTRSRKQKKELHVLYEKISSQNRILLRDDEFKGRLLSMLAHDFRSPLGQTLAMISLLRYEELDRETRLRSFDSIENDIQNILVMFDNILQWVKKQLKGYEFISEELNLFELVAVSADMFKQAVDAKKLTFNNLLDPEQTIKGDREIIQFINRNLIHNAIKYSPVNGVIAAALEMDDKEVVISVRNEGKGMTQKQIHDLFSFKRKDSSDMGAGMALTLCKEFIILQKGRIWVESKPGKGATFYYSLPL